MIRYLKLFPQYFFAVVLFLVLHPYRGIDADGRLYLLQVVNRLHPERLSSDIAFMFGNQDDFSLFSFIYGFFLNVLGVESGTKILFFVISIFWAFSLFFLLRKFSELLSMKQLALVFFLLFLFTDHYYNFGNLGYSLFEKITVARPLSQAFSLLGFGLILAGYKKYSFIAFLLSAMVHPLMGGWGIAIWLFCYYVKSARIIFPLVLLSPLCAFIGMGRFGMYDAEWANCMIFNGTFNIFTNRDITRLLTEFAMLYFVCKNIRIPLFRKLSFALILAGVIAFYIASTGSFLRLIFFAQVQSWRYEWALSVLVPFLSLAMLYQKIKASECYSTQMVGLCSLMLALLFPKQMVWLLLASPLAFLPDKRMSSRTLKFVGFALASFVFIYAVYNIYQKLSLQTGLPIYYVLPSSQIALINRLLVSFSGLLALNKLINAKKCLIAVWRESSGFSLLPLILFMVFPESPLYLFLALLLLLFPNVLLRKKHLLTLLVLLLFIASDFFDSRLFALLSNVSLYNAPIYIQLLRNFAFVFVLFYLFWRISNKWKSFLLCLFSLPSCVVAYYNWDERVPEQIISEKQMQQFWKGPVFPQVQDRGKLFFYSNGFALPWPRSQFLSGAYIDAIANIGDALYRGQFSEYRRRSALITCKNKLKNECRPKNLESYFKVDLSDLDTLVDRIDFLCAQKEINFLASDLSLKYEKLDSTFLMVQKQELYLYSCPE
ncbi:MAG: hypothetical protein M0P13_08930 [Fibrobacteraceae bacterium]|nr:hypothetical protein [Fibrobacteraceae bacterium]